MEGEVLVGAIVLAVVMIATGAMTIVIGRRGAAGRLDYSWGGHTKENTDPAVWAEAHLVAGPRMALAGWLFVASGVVAPAFLLAGAEGAGIAALIGFTIAGVVAMMSGIAVGLGVLSR